ncbi:MAG: kynureninase, partial [Flavobacteriaceae bacterium]
MPFENDLSFARELDKKDPLHSYREEFYFPMVNGKPVIYFTGNSLGLQPKRTQAFVEEVMADWRDLAVEGHFYAKKPWWDYHERLVKPLAGVVGAKPTEISVMNSLTVNLHLLMVSFYQPTTRRYKILVEEKAFPSDQYMINSQVRFHGLEPDKTIVELKKREGDHFWHTADIVKKIDEIGEELALVLLGGVNYYNGQVFEMQEITRAAKDQGVTVGWDLAHAVGNVELDLHKWGVDFAAWCSYKYMNSGPGNASGIFVHEKYHGRKDIA